MNIPLISFEKVGISVLCAVLCVNQFCWFELKKNLWMGLTFNLLWQELIVGADWICTCFACSAVIVSYQIPTVWAFSKKFKGVWKNFFLNLPKPDTLSRKSWTIVRWVEALLINLNILVFSKLIPFQCKLQNIHPWALREEHKGSISEIIN